MVANALIMSYPNNRVISKLQPMMSAHGTALAIGMAIGKLGTVRAVAVTPCPVLPQIEAETTSFSPGTLIIECIGDRVLSKLQ